MADKDWFDDFMEYKLSGSSDTDKKEKDSNSQSGCLPWVLGLIVLLWLLRLFC